jgi:hypothetical protein
MGVATFLPELRLRKIRVSLERSPVDRRRYGEKNNVGRNRAFLLPFSCLILRKSIVIKGVFGLKNRYPAVCSAMDKKIEEMFDVKIIKSSGSQGANHCVTYRLNI